MTGGSELDEVDVDMSDREEGRDWESDTEGGPHHPDPGGDFHCYEIAMRMTSTKTSTLGRANPRLGVQMGCLDHSSPKRTEDPKSPSPKRPVTCLVEKNRDPLSYTWKTGTRPTPDELRSKCLHVIILPPLILKSPLTRAPRRPRTLRPRREGLLPQFMSFREMSLQVTSP